MLLYTAAVDLDLNDYPEELHEQAIEVVRFQMGQAIKERVREVLAEDVDVQVEVMNGARVA